MRGARPNQTHHTTPTCPLHNPICMGSPLEGSTVMGYITSLLTYLHTHGWAFTLTTHVHGRHSPTPSSWEVVDTALNAHNAARCSYANGKTHRGRPYAAQSGRLIIVTRGSTKYFSALNGLEIAPHAQFKLAYGGLRGQRRVHSRRIAMR